MNPFFFLLALLGMGAARMGNDEDDTTVETRSFTSDLPEDVDAPAALEEDARPSAEPIQVVDETPDAPEQPGDGGPGAKTDPIVADSTVEVMAGRVATLSPSTEDATDVKIVSGVEHGTVTVNPDGTFALVMTQSDFVGTQSFTYETTHSDGSTSQHKVTLDVVPGAQEGGWGTGESHYMLATDENDRVIVEYGEVHTKVYISGSTDALSLADIADREGMSVKEVTGKWLADHGEYGQSEDLALDAEAGMALWNAVTPHNSETSNWLLFESGYQYSDLGRILNSGANGENELNPLYLGAWGEGAKPEITDEIFLYQDSSSNLVVQGLAFSDRVFVSYSENVIFDDISVTGRGMSVQGDSESITIRGSDFTDVYYDASKDGGEWELHSDRSSGLFANNVDGLLLEGNFFDHNGWAEGYDPEGAESGGQPPSMWSHNIYLGDNITDVTMRDTITMQASSYGAQIRSGGFIEDNVFIDNNAAFTTVGGDYKDAGPVGQYSLVTDNLVTSGAHKESEIIGAYTLGIDDQALMSSYVDNIVTHLADPNNPDEFTEKYWTNSAISNPDAYYDDTIVYNWVGSYSLEYPDKFADTDQNTDGLDTAVLDQTTIQLFTAQLLGDPDATISDLADYLRAQADGTFDDVVDANLIIQFFQEGFGLAVDARLTATELRFVPSDLGEGVRWDNRLNWDTEDLPGTIAGDSVDLGGNHVVFGTNAEINEMALSDGALNVYGGRLDVTGGVTDGGHLNIEGAGQAWIDGHSGDDVLDVDVTGGRFVNTGEMGATDLTATGGQTVLATDGAEYDVDAGRTLAIFDAAAKVGFDGDEGGIAILDLHEGGTLAYSAASGDIGTIEEYRTGAMGDAPDVLSGIDLGGSTLEIDLEGLSADAGTEFTLMDVDELVGVFDDPVVGGLGARNANIVVDYLNDSVTLQLTAGDGAITVETIGEQTDVTDGSEALWEALTANQGLAEDQPLPEEEDILEMV